MTGIGVVPGGHIRTGEGSSPVGDRSQLPSHGNPVSVEIRGGNPGWKSGVWKSGVWKSGGNPVSVHRGKSGVSSSFLPEKTNRHRITRDTGLRPKR